MEYGVVYTLDINYWHFKRAENCNTTTSPPIKQLLIKTWSIKAFGNKYYPLLLQDISLTPPPDRVKSYGYKEITYYPCKKRQHKRKVIRGLEEGTGKTRGEVRGWQLRLQGQEQEATSFLRFGRCSERCTVHCRNA
jgi:hypothetical protein